jgi:pseudouridine-5'-phosphate glycosidase
LKSAVLLVVPPPQETALEAEKMESAIVTAIAEAVELNIQGSAMTPFLLNRVSELTDGESLQANLALLKNNAWIAGKAAAAMAGSRIIGPF